MTKFPLTSFGVALLALTIFAGSGCSSMTGKMSFPSWGGETSSPKEIVAFWDTILRTEGDQVYRGFAARVYFFDSGSKKALRVKGNFDVYLFDEEATGKAAMIPAKIVRYQVSDLKALESNSKMFGKSYTLWVPWDELTAESDEKKLSLFVRFKSDDGSIIVSKQATMMLPASPEKMAEKAEIEYIDTNYDNRLRRISELTASAQARKNNANSLDTEWKGTVAEHVISSGVRPEMMAVTTINVPGVSRDGVPAITPQRSFASATDAQKYQDQMLQHQSQMLLAGVPAVPANAQNVRNPQVDPALPNANVSPNAGFPPNNVMPFPADNGLNGFNDPAWPQLAMRTLPEQPQLPPQLPPRQPVAVAQQPLQSMPQQTLPQQYAMQQQYALPQQTVPQFQLPQQFVGDYNTANAGMFLR